MARRRAKHLYRGSPAHRAAMERAFERRYGKNKGKYVYGAVVGKVYRARHHGRNWNQVRRR